MKYLFPVSLLLFFTNSFLLAQPAKPLKQVIKLQMPEVGGSNGASVVWHPIQKKYYAAMAGNATYPIAVFDGKGKMISGDTLLTLFDVRGLWYNINTKGIEGNAYDNGGWFAYKLNAKGMPDEIKQLKEGMNQPNEHSVGSYDDKTKKIYFLNEDSIWTYNAVSGNEEIKTKINFGVKASAKPAQKEETDSEDSFLQEDYNTTAVFTGIAGAEFGVMNVVSLQVELYNKQGYLVRTFKLPDEAPAVNRFNFAYANGIWWLFNKDDRAWYGYR
jgi:hypothetical protein